VEVIVHSHNADVSDYMRRRAVQRIRGIAGLPPRAVTARIRFAQDGALRRVEVELHAPGGRRWVAEGAARLFGPALTDAVERLEVQLRRAKRRRLANARRSDRR
jgi:ribosome-associated translation inhibitor RaiA